MADQNQRISDLLDTLTDASSEQIETALRIYEPSDVAAVVAERALAGGGGGGGLSSPSLVSIFSVQQAATSFLRPITLAPGSVAQQLGSDLEVLEDGSGVKVLTAGQYAIEHDVTVYPESGSIGFCIFAPLFTGSDNWISLSEGGTWWVYVDNPKFGGTPEFVRGFPPVPLAVNDVVGVQGNYSPGTDDGGDPIHVSVLLTIVRVA